MNARSWIVVLCLLATPALAVDFTVDTVSDTQDAVPGDGVCQDASGNCSIRAAVAEASARVGSDRIIVPAGTYVMNFSPTFELVFSDTTGVTDFEGAGPGLTIIDGNGASSFRVVLFRVQPNVAVNFSGFTTQNVFGADAGVLNGGPALNTQGVTTVTNVVMRNNFSFGSGGAVAVIGGALTMTNAALINNRADIEEGGGLVAWGTSVVNLQNVTVAGNSANRAGGGLATYLTNSTPTFNLDNVTIVDNVAGDGGGATILAGGFDLWTGTATVDNSVFANNISSTAFGVLAVDCRAAPATNWTGGLHNFFAVGCGDGVAFTDPSNISGPNLALPPATPLWALVGPFLDPTGAGQFIAPLASNALAVDTGSSLAPGMAGACALTDAVGTSRPRDGNDDTTAVCDMGAFELPTPAGDVNLNASISGDTAPPGGVAQYTLTVGNAGPDASSQVVVNSVFIDPHTSTVSWTCSGSGGATCTASGSGNALVDLASIPAGGSVTYSVSANVDSGAMLGRMFDQVLSVGPVDAVDSDTNDNIATVTVTVGSANTPPVANADSYTVLEDNTLTANDADGATTGGDSSDDGVLANDTDDDMDPLSIVGPGTFTANGIGGTVVLASDGTFTYDPPADVSGQASFSYTVTDGSDTAMATATITVSAVNDPPSFLAGPDQVFPGGTSGAQNTANWATNFDPGPQEGGQSLIDYLVSIDSDPEGILNSADVSNAGSLDLDLSGNAGTAMLGVQVQDDGGTANGGVDLSTARTAFVSVGTNANLRVFLNQCTSRTGPGFPHQILATVSNSGPDPANGVEVEITLPPLTTFDGVSSGGQVVCQESAGTVDCTIGTMPRFDVELILVDLTIDLAATDTLVANAAVQAVEPDLATSDNTFSLEIEVIQDMVELDGFESCIPPP